MNTIALLRRIRRARARRRRAVMLARYTLRGTDANAELRREQLLSDIKEARARAQIGGRP